MSSRLVQLLTSMLLLVGCATDSGKPLSFQNTKQPEPESIRAYLSVPEGPGPFAAVMLLHGCTGLELDGYGVVWRGLNSHASELNKAGFVTLIVDSHGSRGISMQESWISSCELGNGYRVRTHDVYGAINYLESREFVKAGSIGAVGFSQGGGVILNAMSASETKGRERLLKAGVAFYPPCNAVEHGPYNNPILILMGSEDDITDASACESKIHAEDYRVNQGDSRPNNLELVVYPGVHHSFDMPLTKHQSTPIGTVSPDRTTRESARARMIAFFRKHLSD